MICLFNSLYNSFWRELKKISFSMFRYGPLKCNLQCVFVFTTMCNNYLPITTSCSILISGSSKFFVTIVLWCHRFTQAYSMLWFYPNNQTVCLCQTPHWPTNWGRQATLHTWSASGIWDSTRKNIHRTTEVLTRSMVGCNNLFQYYYIAFYCSLLQGNIYGDCSNINLTPVVGGQIVKGGPYMTILPDETHTYCYYIAM